MHSFEFEFEYHDEKAVELLEMSCKNCIKHLHELTRVERKEGNPNAIHYRLSSHNIESFYMLGNIIAIIYNASDFKMR